MEKIAALEDAMAKKSMVGIYSVFYTIAHGDPNFSTDKFRDVFRYVKSKGIEGFLQEFDGEEFAGEEDWDEEYWALVASSLMDNFCEERIRHLEQVGRKVYPVMAVEKPGAAADGGTMTEGRRAAGMGKAENAEKGKGNYGKKEGLTADGKKYRVNMGRQRPPKDDGGFLKSLFGGSRR